MALTPHQRLANEIVLRAVEDYRNLLNCKNKNTRNERFHLESFFKGSWFQTLTILDGELLLKNLKKEKLKM